MPTPAPFQIIKVLRPLKKNKMAPAKSCGSGRSGSSALVST